MGLFNKKRNPVEERARALEAEIAAIDAKIRKLKDDASHEPAPKLRSTAWPQGSPPPAQPNYDLVIEEGNQNKIHEPREPASTPQHYNELGVRKYDLGALFQRGVNHFRSKPVTNPKLVNFLAAGSVHGLRPLRYEKRIARNRFIFFSIVLALVIWGLVAMLLRQH
jgi:hypothetical protein